MDAQRLCAAIVERHLDGKKSDDVERWTGPGVRSDDYTHACVAGHDGGVREATYLVGGNELCASPTRGRRGGRDQRHGKGVREPLRSHPTVVAHRHLLLRSADFDG